MRWFRFYSEALDDPKVQRLPADLFKAWVNLLCLANDGTPRGTLPSIEDIAFRLRLSAAKAQTIVDDLVNRGLIDADGETLQPHNWNDRQFKSDNVTERVQRSRMKQQDGVTENVTCNVSETLHVTPPDTDTETDTETEQIASDKPTRPRTRKPVERDALTEAIGRVWRPGRDWSSLTETEQKTCARASAELFRIGATAEQIEQARAAWDRSRKWRDLTFTPDALKKHWGELLDIARPSPGYDPTRHREVILENGQRGYIDI